MTRVAGCLSIERIVIATLMMLSAIAPAAAQNLVEVYRAARQFDAPYASARQVLEATREKIPQGRAGLLPTINTTAGRNWNYIENNAPGRLFNDLNFRNQSWGVTLSQPLYRPANSTVLQQAELQVTAAESTFAQANLDLAIRVSQAYFDILNAEDTLRVIGSQKIATTEQLAQARRNFEVGTATITDTNEAQARFDLVIAQEIAAQNDLEVKRRALAQIAGRYYPNLEKLRTPLNLPPAEPNNMDTWVQRSQDSSFNVRTQEANWEIARREIDRNRAGHLPTLDLVGSTNRAQGVNQLSGTRTDTTTSVVGIQFALPIFAGGAVLSRVREAVASQERARADLDNVRRTAEFATRQSFLNYTNGLAQVRALEQAEKSSEIALASNRLGYEVGVRINIDVLNAQQQLFQTRRDLAKARYDTIVNGLRLKSAAGVLTEEDLEQVSRLLGG